MRDYDLVLDKIAFANSVDKLSPWFQLSTTRDVSEIIAYQAFQGFSTTIPTVGDKPTAELTQLVDTLINTQEGAYNTHDYVNRLSTTFLNSLYRKTSIALAPLSQPAGTSNTSGTDNFAQRVTRLFKVLGPRIDIGGEAPFYDPRIQEMLRRSSGQDSVINSNPNSPSKQNPSLSIVLINTCKIAPINKNTNAITLFLNSIPTIEMSRAIPFIKAQFFFGREPVDDQNNIQTLSLIRFLEGAVNVGNTGIDRLLVDANTVSGSIAGGRSEETGILSTAGMELFCSPQTLVNANERFSNSLRPVPVIDPFRPFMTFKSLTIDIAPSVGLMSYKTAKMEFTLHDRSRLHEIADFIKPDLYGTTEILLEYGWSHPDVPNGSSLEDANPYGVLINGMRSKEKYGIRNVSFSFDEGGQVNIVLDLFMKGSNDFYTETIGNSSEDGIENTLRTIERLAKAVTAYERRMFGGRANNRQEQTGGHHTREIRGSQILESAGDWQGQLRLTPGMVDNLKRFEAELRHLGTNAVDGTARTELIAALDQLYTRRTSPTNDAGEGALAELSTQIQRAIERKLRLLHGSIDPILENSNIPLTVRNSARIASGVRHHWDTAASETSSNNNVNEASIDDTNISPTFSLAKLLTVFVGEPLANTHKYDDVQFIFYPFNEYAGFANTLNVGQFPVDTKYFIRQYTRFRTENLSRASNVNLKEFLNFVASTLIDDPGATVYGISDLFKQVESRQTHEVSLQPNGNAIEYQTRLENTLRNRTPDASFKMPQIDFYIECLPGKILDENNPVTNNAVSILRIHIFDRQSSQYTTQSNLLGATRDDTLNAIGSLPQSVNDGEEGIRESYRAVDASMRAAAGTLITPVAEGSNSYRINGGPQEIKNFVMKTMPYILYGIQGTGIKGNANLSTQQDPALSTVNMLRSFRAGPLQANGEQPGGLPLSIIPCELSLLTYGCPLIDFAQQFFVDFGTGTTADNIYGVVGLSHKLTPGLFDSDIKFAPLDAYGKYNSLIENLNRASQRLASSTNTN